MSTIRQLSRRDFLKTGGVLVLGVSMIGCGREPTPIATRSVSVEPWSPDVFISFDADGTVHIISHRSEMGQGIRTGLPAVVADEMGREARKVDPKGYEQRGPIDGAECDRGGEPSRGGLHPTAPSLHDRGRIRRLGAMDLVH